MKHILVPCDFSQPAIDGFRTALDVAHKLKAHIHLLHVIEIPVSDDSLLMPMLNFEAAAMKDSERKALDQLMEVIARYNTHHISVRSAVAFGNVRYEIVRYAERNHVDMIVMGSHGSGGFREIFIGSNAEKTVRLAAVPVLVVKSYQEKPVKSIIFP